MILFRFLAALTLLVFLIARAPAQEKQVPTTSSAQAFRQGNQPVAPISKTTILAEAEEFQGGAPGWRAQPWGANYYAATLANAFLSRKAFLGAPEQCQRSTAALEVEVPAAGRYLALVRYEAAYRFETQFRLQIEQNGKQVLDRLYGARQNPKVWAFRQKVKPEVGWGWGAVENVVWEGHDAFVDLQPGKARLVLVADRQPEPAARRNVDLVLLTSDVENIKTRIEKENYLPLDGLLTQAGDVYLKASNLAGGPAVTLTVGNGTEHSPYWVHLRDWKPEVIKVMPGMTTEWIEVGHLLDSLNDGQWAIKVQSAGKPLFHLEFGVRSADGKISSIRRFENQAGNLALVYDADMRYSRRIRTPDEVLAELVAYLKKQPVQGTPPRRTLVFGYTFEHNGNPAHDAQVDEFTRLIGATALSVGLRSEVPAEGSLIRGYLDVRSVATNKLEEYCQKLKTEGKAERVAVVSLGDEIGLARPPANAHADFRAWLRTQAVNLAEIDSASGGDLNKINYSLTPESKKTQPGLYYYSALYAYRYGIRQLKERTDILRRHLPNAGIGANFSPHHGHAYLGETHHWISLFREDGMTMPWGEDYIWQVPVGTQQMNSIMVDMFRAGIRGKPERKIHYYVMPHWPGNTPASWRRQFYGTLAHGAKVLNLFEFRPVQAAYTENHVSLPAMYQEVRQGLHELGGFEDIVQDGQVRPGVAGLWFSEAGDVWDDARSPFDVGKRTLYIAIRQQQLPLDCVVEGDDLKSYKLLYLTDAHVSRPASRAIAEWVSGGGRLIATAGAGMFDEFNQPNKILRSLLGVEQQALEEAPEPIRFAKQDLPFTKTLDQVALESADSAAIAVFGVRSKCTLAGATVTGRFISDKSPAVTVKKTGGGETTYLAFLPGLSYFKPAIPLRPVDRGTTDDSMDHFIPTEFDSLTTALLANLSRDVNRPVLCSERLVENTVIEAKQGIVIPLINWSKGPIKGLMVTVNIPVPARSVVLASGKPVRMTTQEGKTVFTLDLDVADSIVLRR